MQLGSVAFKDLADAAELGTSKEGVAQAFYTLGLLYSTGQGVPFDSVEAHKWFNLAATMGNEEARLSRAQIAQDMSALEVAAAQRRAREWLQAR